MTGVNELKRTVFYEMLKTAGRVFVVAGYSEDMVIGTRGLTDDEMRNGIVLVFNEKMKFSWDDRGISASLLFETTPQRCFIPADDIVAVYSPELNAQFVTVPQSREIRDEGKGQKADGPQKDLEAGDSKVVSVDFQKKREKVPKK